MNMTATPSRLLKQPRTIASYTTKDATTLANHEKENKMDKSLPSQAHKESKKPSTTPIIIKKTRRVLGELSASEVQVRNAAHAIQNSENRREQEEVTNRQDGSETARSSGGRRNESVTPQTVTRLATTTRKPRQSVKKEGENHNEITQSTPRLPSILRQQPPRKASEAARAASNNILTARAESDPRRIQPLARQEIISDLLVTASS